MRTLLFLAVSVAFLLQAGCNSDTGRPTDLPKLYRVNITVIQDGKPLEDAIVTLEPKIPTTYSSSAKTNASGIATIQTYGYNGVPAGDYAVLVQKIGSENQVETKTEQGETLLSGGQSYDYVDARYADRVNPQFSITVTEKGAQETFDVGKAVRVFRRNNP